MVEQEPLLSSTRGGLAGAEPKGLVEMDRKKSRKTFFEEIQGPNENRFEMLNFDNLPNINSKFERNNRGFSFDKMCKRDYKGLITKSVGGDNFYSGNQTGQLAQSRVKGQVSFIKQSEKNSAFRPNNEWSTSPSFYTYADSVSKA